MDDLSKAINDLKRLIDKSVATLNTHELKAELDELTAESQQPDFWNEATEAQAKMKQISKLDTRTKPWLELEKISTELVELVKLNDESLRPELEDQIQQLDDKFDALKEDLKFDGPYDDHSAILSIYAGAGGTDAQDWTKILFRMYSRYFEKNDWKYTVIEESTGEEAGLKSITIEVDGNYAYGKLKGEHGVHRLVRLSPFNADNLRQTSFSKVEVMPLIDKPTDLEIDDKDLKIDVYRSGGHGGQSVNTTDSAVRVTHIPSGVTVAIQNERSQLQNRETAMTILRSRLAQMQLEQHLEKLNDLKGPSQSAEWGNQIRSYVLHPYKQVKDLRTRHETSDPDAVLDGELEPFIQAYLDQNLSQDS
jgi:peptide chain release factor 2